MALILSLETSGNVCSAALHSNSQLVVSEKVEEPQAHANKLAILIQNILSKVQLSIRELEAVAITSGPGSYTGLRIGTSTAKGICYALNIPLVAVSTLELLAYQGRELAQKESLLCPMIDARRMEVYCMIADARGVIVQPMQASVIDENSFGSLLEKNKIIFYGDGAAKCKSMITNANAIFVEDIIPSINCLGEIASKKLEQGQIVDLVHFEPFYLKEFQVKKSTKSSF